VTPADPSKVSGWMTTGFATWAALREAGHQPIEVYPAGVFRVLHGTVPPKKATLAGLRARVALLAPHVVLPDSIDMWSHDGLDATAAALVARWSTDGRAERIGHTEAGCDLSSVWIPMALSRGATPEPAASQPTG
jgi:hypothetical protein